MQPILSICIPTYKRTLYLRDNIEVIAKQLEVNSDCVEFIISDNNSNDDTRDVVDALKNEYSLHLTYYYQETPLYFEDNFDFVVDRASGLYIYLMGDDDLVSPDFINIIFRLIKKGYEVIHFNKLIGDENCSKNVLFHKDFFSLEKSYIASDFIKELLWRPNFMSSVIFSREVWKKGKCDDLQRMYGYRFLGRIYIGSLLQHSKCCYYYMPLLLMRNPQRAWSVRYPYFLVCWNVEYLCGARKTNSWYLQILVQLYSQSETVSFCTESFGCTYG